MVRSPIRMLVPALALLGSAAVARAAADAWPTSGWQTSTPEAQGMDSEKLAAMLSFLGHYGYAVDGLLVVRHGKLVLEAYARPYGPDRPHDAGSCAKSLVSILYGVAVGEGKLAGVDQPLSAVFSPRELGGGMDDQTFHALLTMTSGIGEPQPSKEGEDWVRAALATPPARLPGSFYYSNVSGYIVLTAVARATGKAGPDYAREKLFEPMGMKGVVFALNGQGEHAGGDRLELLPRDLAKLGYLYLRKGVWDGKQLVPAAWVEASTRKQVETANLDKSPTISDGDPLGKHGYGYFWWMEDFGGYSAVGRGSAFVFVTPEKDLVVVFTGMPDDPFVPRAMMRDFILPAIRSDASLPPAPRAQARLREQVARLR